MPQTSQKSNLEELEPFTKSVIEVVQKIPKGKVATYMQVAGLAGSQRASRAVASILKSYSKKYKLPWQRVISSSGKIAFKPQTYNFLLQRRLLQSENIFVTTKNGQIDLGKYQYRKNAHVKHKPNQPRMFGK